MSAKRQKTLKSILLDLLISIAMVFIGFGTLPYFLQYGFTQKWGLQFALAALALAAVVVLFSVYFFVLRGRTGRNGWGRLLAGTTLTFLLLLAGVVAVSLLYGLLALLLQGLLANSVTVASIKFVISITTTILTVLLMPVFIAALFGAGYHEGGVFAGIKEGLAGLKRTYWKLLLIVALGTLLGYGLTALLGPGSILYGLATGVKAVLFSVLGTAGIFLSAKICKPAS